MGNTVNYRREYECSKNNVTVFNEDTYRQLFHSVSDGLCICELQRDQSGEIVDWRYVDVNSQMEQYIVIRIEELKGKLHSELTKQEKVSTFLDILDSTLCFMKSNKEIFIPECNQWLRLKTCPFYKDFIAIIVDDITENKQAELELLQSRAQLAKELIDTKRLQDLSSELYCEDNIQVMYEKIIDVAAQIMRSDYASMQMFYPEHGEDGGLRLLAYRGFNEQAAKFWEWVDVTDKSTCGQAFVRGVRVIEPDLVNSNVLKGSEDLHTYLQTGIYACQTTPLQSRSGKLVGMISTHWNKPHHPSERDLRMLDILARQAADIIERVRNLEKLKDSEQRALTLVDELRMADKNKNEFLAVLSHELRNPLAAVVMGLAVLDKSTIGDEKNQKFLSIIERQTNQLSKLIDDLLDVTRITRKKVLLKKEICAINHLVLDVIQDYQAQFDEKNIKLGVTLPNEPLRMLVDPTRMKQIIGNLLHNAVKFTSKDGGQTVVTVSGGVEEIFISIKDQGIGMEQDVLANLFLPFMQAEISFDRSAGGLGLGLTIVKGMVELHDGRIEAISEGKGKGTEFILRFPKAQDPIIKKDVESNGMLKTDKRLRVLIVEDIPDIIETLSAVITYLGHEVKTASNGFDGLKIAQSYRPHIVFCDIGLPEMSGYEFARKIQKESNMNNMFLIALTGYALPEDIEHAKEVGFFRHIAKPVEVKKLKQIFSDISNKLSEEDSKN